MLDFAVKFLNLSYQKQKYCFCFDSNDCVFGVKPSHLLLLAAIIFQTPVVFCDLERFPALTEAVCINSSSMQACIIKNYFCVSAALFFAM